MERGSFALIGVLPGQRLLLVVMMKDDAED